MTEAVTYYIISGNVIRDTVTVLLYDVPILRPVLGLIILNARLASFLLSYVALSDHRSQLKCDEHYRVERWWLGLYYIIIQHTYMDT